MTQHRLPTGIAVASSPLSIIAAEKCGRAKRKACTTFCDDVDAGLLVMVVLKGGFVVRDLQLQCSSTFESTCLVHAENLKLAASW
jgi:hypothetical protein